MLGIDFQTYDVATGATRHMQICMPCHDDGPPLPWHLHPRNPAAVNVVNKCEHPNHGQTVDDAVDECIRRSEWYSNQG